MVFEAEELNLLCFEVQTDPPVSNKITYSSLNRSDGHISSRLWSQHLSVALAYHSQVKSGGRGSRINMENAWDLQ